MKIMMVTNTYLPHVGGVAQSVHRFTTEYRRMGHRVLVAAPEFADQPEVEEDVWRVGAIQNFNGSDFSFSYPTLLAGVRKDLGFEPDIVHSHHPYLLGDAALRFSGTEGVPIVFTHHTMYEQYTHYVPGDSPTFKRFIVELSTRYANLCQAVVAPSGSVRDILRERGVETPIDVIPTGVDLERFGEGVGEWLRLRYRVPEDGCVIGHLGRLAQEKNLDFLSRAVATYMKRNEKAHFLVVGGGPSRETMESYFASEGLGDRLHLTGPLSGQDLVDAYYAMDVFAFASKSETQGMVLAEAMAADVPVVAVDAPGVREVVRDEHNGRLLMEEDEDSFADALAWVLERGGRKGEAFGEAVAQTAHEFSSRVRAQEAIALYERVLAGEEHPQLEEEEGAWDRLLGQVEREWDLWSNRIAAAAEALTRSDERKRAE